MNKMLLSLLTGAAASLLVLPTTPTLADGVYNDIEVTTTVDNLDAFDQQCSLREAIHNVRNADLFSPVVNECAAGSNTLSNRIVLSSGATYNLTLQGSGADEGDLNMVANAPPSAPNLIITTDGSEMAAIVQTAPGRRVLDNVGAWIEIDNVGIFGGNIVGAGVGGGIRNQGGVMVLSQVDIDSNSAGSGGGIYNTGTLDISNSNLRLNSAPSGQGGGALFNSADGSIEVRDSLLRANSAIRGGAVRNLGTMVIRDSMLTLNTATKTDVEGGGGAIHSDGDAILSIHDSQFDSNSALDGVGGAIAHRSSADLQIRGSSLVGNSASLGGAILSTTPATLWVHNSEMRDNTAPAGGGAIYGWTAHVHGSQFIGNSAVGAFGGGGAIWALTAITVIESRFTGNAASFLGGAIAADRVLAGSRDNLFEENQANLFGGAIGVNESIRISRSRFINNSAGVNGGGLSIDSSSPEASEITQSLFTENSAAEQGGGLWVRSTQHFVTVANSTITGNQASGDNGGGLYVHADTVDNGRVVAINATFAGNLPGREIVKMGDMSLANTIIVSAGPNNCLASLDNPFFNSLGSNISNDASCPGLNTPTDMINTSPMLSVLADNGGNTLTFALLPGSPAIDAGNELICFQSPVSSLDQRGALRPLNGCDIGAHEQGATFDRIFGHGFEATTF